MLAGIPPKLSVEATGDRGHIMAVSLFWRIGERGIKELSTSCRRIRWKS
jgi:hypothetical protein